MNSVYYYPAVFQKEDVGFSVWVPDLEGCISQGDTFQEAMQYIQEAIGLCLEDSITDGSIPKSSDPSDIQVDENQFIAIVGFDYNEYQKKFSSKAVKKTLTVPAWLNTLSEKNNINFSQVLQNALMHELKISE